MGGNEELSLRTEIRPGRDMAAALLNRTPLAQENERTQFAVQIGQWPASQVKEKQVPFTVQVIAEGEPNAMALPGGPPFVSWPLLELCQWQRDPSAFVLGHETAHLVLRHTLDRIVKDAALSLLLRQWASRQTSSAWLNLAGRALLSRAYSRADELEADAFAVVLVRTAGGDPAAAERLLEDLAKLAADGGGGIPGAYYASHPSLADRVANLRARRQG